MTPNSKNRPRPGPRRGGPPRSRTPGESQRKRQAQELAERSGIPIRLAYPILDGRTTLDKVLKAMLAREKTHQLVEQYGISPSLAGQIARGHVPLDKALARWRRRKSEYWRARFSQFDCYPKEEAPVGLLRFEKPWRVGRITRVEKYELAFEGQEGLEPVLKHEVKLVVPDASAVEKVQAAMDTDEAVREKNLSATANLNERLRLDKETFFDQIQEEETMRFVFRDGDVLAGTVKWFSRYEFGVQLEEEIEVVGFFHALVDWGSPGKKKARPSGDEPAADESMGKKGRARVPKQKKKKKKRGRR